MTRQERAILYGLAIGDGHISHRNRLTKDKNGVPKYPYVQAELIIGHSTKQADYIEHKANLLHSIFGGKKPTIAKTATRLGDKTYPGLRITKTNPYFRQMHRVLYPTGRKVYTQQLLNYLDEHSLALWFMDDGSMQCNKNSKGEVTSLFATITTHCPEEEAKLLKDWFRFYWGVDIKLRQDGTVFNLGFNTKSCHKLADIVWKYTIPSMQYKFRHLHDFVLRTSARHPHFNMTGDDIVRPLGNINSRN